MVVRVAIVDIIHDTRWRSYQSSVSLSLSWLRIRDLTLKPSSSSASASSVFITPDLARRRSRTDVWKSSVLPSSSKPVILHYTQHEQMTSTDTYFRSTCSTCHYKYDRSVSFICKLGILPVHNFAVDKAEDCWQNAYLEFVHEKLSVINAYFSKSCFPVLCRKVLKKP